MLGFQRFTKMGYTAPGRQTNRAKYRNGSFKNMYGGGMYESVYVNKDDPNYKPHYRTEYSERQKKILNEEVPLENVRANEIKKIMNKAEFLKDKKNFCKAKNLYEVKTHIEKYCPNVTLSEAQSILQELTPWEIDWSKKNG